MRARRGRLGALTCPRVVPHHEQLGGGERPQRGGLTAPPPRGIEPRPLRHLLPAGGPSQRVNARMSPCPQWSGHLSRPDLHRQAQVSSESQGRLGGAQAHPKRHPSPRHGLRHRLRRAQCTCLHLISAASSSWRQAVDVQQRMGRCLGEGRSAGGSAVRPALGGHSAGESRSPK